MQTIRFYLTGLLMPFIKSIRFFGKPEPRRTQNDLDAILKVIKPGDVLLSREDYRLSNLFIKGFWSHAAICVGANILEALPPKVRLTSLAEFVLSVDSISVLRPMFPMSFTDLSEEYVGIEYDFWFLPKNEMYFCNELVVEYLERISDVKIRAATPQDLYTARFRLIYEAR